MTRRSYSREFKQEAVRLAETTGNTAKTARELGIQADRIRRWRKQLGESHDQARRALFEYIEVFYNRQRMHQTLDYLTPEEAELAYDIA